MFPIAHLGLGAQLAKPFMGGEEKASFFRKSPERLPWKFVLLGSIFPDLLDKPIYYVQVLMTGKTGEDLGLLCGTRTIGHMVLLIFFFLFLGYFRNSLTRVLPALALGMTTHLVLDQFGDFFWESVLGMSQLSSFHWKSDRFSGLFFPLLGLRFPCLPFETLKEHALTGIRIHYVVAEVVGGFILWREWRKLKRR